MACNCKQKAVEAGKYSDDWNVLERVNGMEKIFVFLARLLLTISSLGLIIVILPFFLVYVIVSMILGKGIKVNLAKILKFSNAERK